MKFFGNIGFAETVETKPGVFRPTIVERPYYGDLIKNNRRLEGTNQVNEDVNISNQISVLSDPYANQNYHAIRYVEFMGTKWKVTSIDVQFPRLVLSFGGVYNDEE